MKIDVEKQNAMADLITTDLWFQGTNVSLLQLFVQKQLFNTKSWEMLKGILQFISESETEQICLKKIK